MNGWPVTPAGNKHLVTDVTVIVVPGGPEVGDTVKVAVAAHAGADAMTAQVNIPRPAAPSLPDLLINVTSNTIRGGPLFQPILRPHRITPSPLGAEPKVPLCPSTHLSTRNWRSNAEQRAPIPAQSQGRSTHLRSTWPTR